MRLIQGVGENDLLALGFEPIMMMMVRSPIIWTIMPSGLRSVAGIRVPFALSRVATYYSPHGLRFPDLLSDVTIHCPTHRPPYLVNISCCCCCFGGISP